MSGTVLEISTPNVSKWIETETDDDQRNRQWDRRKRTEWLCRGYQKMAESVAKSIYCTGQSSEVSRGCPTWIHWYMVQNIQTGQWTESIWKRHVFTGL
ncbi:hypothetical protein PGTUg99_012350 [Puccinia graminis f. sp. tritici]|uniref:Uncharacterized protein n=1 Tax=Puccinia graminis f. sp. tritici TaxID=56615 RepID=A0A5B0SIM9_PUCGR|nr:hypothetical protein PGTUg99_012350 [Puccinia graminis f. sp. tritici]